MDESPIDLRKIVDLSYDKLTALGFWGDTAPPAVIKIVKSKDNPTRLALGRISCFEVDCVRRHSTRSAAKQDAAASSTSGDAEAMLSTDPDARTIVAPHLISKYERRFFYHGISSHPPELLYRSDLETNPFPHPPPGAHFFEIPSKTANGVFNTPLNIVWDKVAPQIIASVKGHGIKWTALKTVRFTTTENDKATVGPVVIWIAVRPDTTNAETLRNVTPELLGILSDFDITGVVIQWYEGEVRRLVDSI